MLLLLVNLQYEECQENARFSYRCSLYLRHDSRFGLTVICSIRVAVLAPHT